MYFYIYIFLEAAQDFYRGLYQLFSDKGCFKALKIPFSAPLYIHGQGYATKFASAFASKLINQQKAGGAITGFKGLILGGPLNNPWRTLT